jgi:hypothetical protein
LKPLGKQGCKRDGAKTFALERLYIHQRMRQGLQGVPRAAQVVAGHAQRHFSVPPVFCAASR